VKVICGDCLEVLPTFEGESFDACVTDPPYGLEFMGKGWDHGVPGIPFWQAVLRVLKPGAHLLAFGGTRTHHRLMCAIEDAGFEIRDTVPELGGEVQMLMWLYGQGFPKSLDVSKAIDKAAGAKREVLGQRTGAQAKSDGLYGRPDTCGNAWGNDRGDGVSEFDITAPATDAARQWDGWGTALKPAWEPIVLARKPLIGTVAANVLAHGTGAINVDGCRIGTEGGTTRSHQSEFQHDGESGKVHATRGYRTGHDIVPVDSGRWPANVILTHTPECREVGTRNVQGAPHLGQKNPDLTKQYTGGTFGGGRVTPSGGYADPDGTETVAAWDCAPDCPVRMLDEQGGARRLGRPDYVRSERDFSGWEKRGSLHSPTSLQYKEVTSGVSRFLYCAKASRRERDYGLEEMPAAHGVDRGKARNDHPTVKPVAVMRWLVRLVTPPGGTVLDPFMGSGTTKLACMAERFDFTGIDLDAHYCDIAEHRKLLPDVEREVAQAGMSL